MMKNILLIASVSLFLQSCYVRRAILYNFAGVNDFKKFAHTELKKSETPFHFVEIRGNASAHVPKQFKRRSRTFDFEKGLKKTGTQAFLIIRNDSILYQWYRPGKNESSMITSFSISKSFVSALLGIAIHEGLIKSTEDSITRYIPFLDKETFGKVKIQHLLDMRSGIAFDENYFGIFSDITKYYYGDNLKQYLHDLKMECEPGTRFKYLSLNTQLLGLIIENASGKSLTEYTQEKLWTPLGMEYDASWSIDSKKYHTEKAFCCVNGRAIDFAKLGKLYINQGNYNGIQLVPASWVETSVVLKDTNNGLRYSNHWWHKRQAHAQADSSTITGPHFTVYPKDPKKLPFIYSDTGDYFAQGILGQYLYISPEHHLIIVRFSKKEGGIIWTDLLREIAIRN